MKKKPLIGITPLYNIELEHMWMQSNYLEAIQVSGGIPIVLPLNSSRQDMLQLIGLLDGILFTGGPDIMPHLFGERVIEECGIQCPVRDELELELVRFAYNVNLPIMGICRGIQTINVALGGTLYQDIPIQFKGIEPVIIHSQTKRVPDTHPIHLINIEQNSILFNIVGKNSLMVNSFHHQSIKKLASDFIITAKSEDGVIEAIESTNDRFVLGVQWHPEKMFRNDPISLDLFCKFIEVTSKKLD